MKNENVLKNNAIQVTVLHKPNSLVTLNVIVFPEIVRSTHEEATKLAGQDINLTGSNKDKIQDSNIAKQHQALVHKYWHELILAAVLKEANALKTPQPLHPDAVKCTKIDELILDQECEMCIEFESFPQVPFIDIAGITLHNVQRRAVTRNDVAFALEKIQLTQATWTNVTNRSIIEGDYVNLDICAAEEPHSKIYSQALFFVKKGKISEWLFNALLGKALRSQFKVTSQPDQPLHPSMPFEATQYLVIVNEIKKPTLPELNDDLAKKAGAAHLLELKERITGDLNHHADQEIFEKLRQELESILLTNYPINIPETIIKEESQLQIDNLTSHLEKQNAPRDVINKNIENLKNTLSEKIVRDFRLYFLLNSFSHQRNIRVSREEIAGLRTHLETNNKQNPILSLSKENIDVKLGTDILLRKSMDYIIHHVCRQ